MRGFKWVALVAIVVMAAEVKANELLINGGFEAGFAGWTIFDQPGGSGSFFIDNADGFTPFSGLPTVGPASGNFYAVSDQGGPGAHALSQTFTVPALSTGVFLSFDMFVNDWDSGPLVDPAGLDYTAGPNQHARVDILTAGSPPLSTTTGLLANYYLGVDGGNDPNPYIHYVFDITSIVGGGGSFTLRFAEVDNQSFFNQGVDNVSIKAGVVPVPLAALGGFALLGVVGVGRALRGAGSQKCEAAE